MKTTHTNLKSEMVGRLFQWAAFVAAVASVLALVAVLTGWGNGRLASLSPRANDAWQQYAVNADWSVIFNAR